MFLFCIVDISFINYDQAIKVIQQDFDIVSVNAVASWVIGGTNKD